MASDAVQELKNQVARVAGVQGAAREIGAALDAVARELEDLVGSGAAVDASDVQLAVANCALQLEPAIPQVEAILAKMKALAGTKALKQAGAPIKWFDNDGKTELKRPGRTPSPTAAARA